MPRKARTFSSTGIYHIILRSVNQQLIFEEASDCHKFLSLLLECKNKYDIDIYAYCLMDNHIHLLASFTEENLSSFFLRFETQFALWYNKKYGRYGHLFQGRFHSKIIESLDYFLNTLIYIHDNPVRAGICRYPTEYFWSSSQAYYGAKNPLVNVSYACDLVGSKDSLLHYFSIKTLASDISYAEFEDSTYIQRISEDERIKLFKKITNINSPSDIQHLPKTKRNEIIRQLKHAGFTGNQIMRFCGVSRQTIYRICKNVT